MTLLTMPSRGWQYLRSKIERDGNLYILPTPVGYYFVVVTFILFIISMFYAHSLSYTSTFLFFSLMCTSAYFTNNNLKGVDISLEGLDQVCFEDEQSFKVHLISNSLHDRYQIRSKVRGFDSIEIDLPSKKSQMILVETKLPFGIHRIKRVVLESTFPFGIFRVWSIRKNIDEKLYIAPKRVKHAAFTQSSFRKHQGIGDQNDIDQYGREEFYEYKEYRQGDPVNNIDWKKSQLHGSLIVRKFNEKSNEIYSISINEVISKINDRALALQTCSYFIDSFYKQGLLFSLSYNDIHIPLGNTKHHRNLCIKLLCDAA